MSELIECDGCGRSFATEHPAEMLAAIKGACPTCGGVFRLAPPRSGAPSSPRASVPRSALPRHAL